METPTIRRLKGNFEDMKEYMLEGGTLRKDWEDSLKMRDVGGVLQKEKAWCRITIWFDNDELGSYGGTVWPTAWPELFQALPSSAQLGSGRIALTQKGKELLRQADLLEKESVS
jgi:hypothetical protein